MKTADRIDRLGSALIYGHHGIVVAVGAFGIIEAPSPAVASVIGGQAAAYIWSSMFMVFGLLALGCRFANRQGLKWHGRSYRLDTTRSEALCIVFIGLAMLMFSGLITLAVLDPTPVPGSQPPGTMQTALAMLSSSVFLPGVAALSLAITRRERLRGGAHTQQVLHHVAREVRRSTLEEQ